ncbi:MAG: glycosyltransferase [Burkholderiaceae bacterium]
MKIAIVTDAWRPQINGVATTLSRLVGVLQDRAHQVLMVTPDRFFGIPVPCEPGMRLALCPPGRMRQIRRCGVRDVVIWGRGVDTELFCPGRSDALAGLPRPIHLSVGRLAPEKNLEAFLDLPLPGSKVVIGDGPRARRLRERYPEVRFLGPIAHELLPPFYRAADVFVFPSRTDTFGLVMLEALACGTPVAAFPADAPMALLDRTVGAIDEDLREACSRAVELNRLTARAYAERFTWDAVGERFLSLLASPAAVRTHRERFR